MKRDEHSAHDYVNIEIEDKDTEEITTVVCRKEAFVAYTGPPPAPKDDDELDRVSVYLL